MRSKSAYMALRLAVLLCSFLPMPSSSSAQVQRDGRERRVQLLQEKLLEGLSRMDGNLKKNPGPVEIRDVTSGALVAAATGNLPLAERLLRLAYDQQEMRPGTAFGEMPWNVGLRDIHDENATDFATESLGPLLVGYGSHLSEDFKSYIRPHAAAALVALARQTISVGYTNIYTMNFTNTILIAQWLGDEKSLQHGIANFHLWLDYTGKAGIHEFDSPTYTGIAMNAFYMGYQFAAVPEVREKYKASLDYFWTDVAGNYFASGRRLAGARSRDYDFLTGLGSVSEFLFIEGFQDDYVPGGSPERAYLLVSTHEGGYRATARPFPLNSSRIITQRWDEDLHRFRYTYITPEFAMGTANGHYGPQDKMFAMDFAGMKPNPKDDPISTVYLATTTNGVPYGKNRAVDKSGHAKPRHLNNGLGTVQDKGLALLIADANAKDDKSADRFFVDMVLPSRGEITLNGTSVRANRKFTLPIMDGDTIGVRIGTACFALKPFGASGPGLLQSLTTDEDGLSLGVLRLSTQFRPQGGNGAMRTTYLAYAQACEGTGNVAEKKIRAAKTDAVAAGGQLTAEARMGDTTLTILYNLNDRSAFSNRVNGKEFVTPPLHVTQVHEVAGGISTLP